MELQLVKKSCCILCCWLASFVVVAEESATSVDSPNTPLKVAGVPPGFQFLLEKQTTAIDVFYGDVYITTTLASYTPTTVEFHNPNDVVAQLNNLLTPEQVELGLTGEIDSHAGEVCYHDANTDCGVITPESVGVIFDEGKFRADIFINPNLLSIQQQDLTRYLPAPSTGFSSLNNLSLVYTGSDQGQDATSLNGQSLVSFREQRVISNWNYIDNSEWSRFSVNNLYWQMDKTDFQYQAGWFDSDARFLSFVPNVDLLGFRYSTSLKARTDLSFASGSPIQLYLPTRSRVNIYKDGKFLSTAFYNPGNQLLDTSNLPDGAYDIELRIVDSAGREEIITRFFVKTQRLAPQDQDLYFVEVGDVQEYLPDSTFPESENIAIAQGGYSHRLTDTLGLNTGVSMTSKDEFVSEFGLYHVADMYELEPRIMLGAQGEYGWSFNAYARVYDWSASYQLRRVWTDELRTIEEFHLVPAAFKQHVLSVGHPLFEGYAQLRYSNSEREDQAETSTTAETTSLVYHKPMVFGSGRYTFYSEITKSGEDSLFLLGVDWNWRENKTYHSINTEFRHEDTELYGKDNYFRAGYRGYWLDDDLRPEDIVVNWNAQVDNNLTNVGLDGSVNAWWGTADLGVNYTDSVLTGDGYLYGGQASTTIAGEASTWGVGGKTSAQGALVLDVSSDNENTKGYLVYVNNILYGEIGANQRVVIPVTPYQTYKVKLEDRGSEFVSFAQQTRSVTIYPGNVKALTWEARGLGILIGKVVRKVPGCFNDNDPQCWAPLVHARAKGVNDVAVTDTEGYIQTEVFRSEPAFSLIRKGSECRVDISNLKFVEGMAYAEEDLKCYEVDTSVSPAE